ncbi:serine/threonine dehydratase [Rhodobium gokarnense]|uniref:Threonine dehydratase n=1 Tax=Rhodobium gokarnense TaxID=364296 RepID=A0ABT3HDZ1_9HYPH|nr:serine/threonine dehydratase [Rhodobium gokarnense]MCW2308620.1 threonine dehydratase [Rhodobium gokarnense]
MFDTVSPELIRSVHSRIRNQIRRTPVLHTAPGDFELPAPVVVKLEQMQFAGSFKARGAFNTLLSNEIPPTGVTAASGGNHGAAVAFAADRLGELARIYVPETVAPAKADLIRRYGADVHIEGETYADAAALCEEYAADTGALLVHPYDSFDTIAGQGTLGLEWEEQALGLDTVLVAVGGGGLIAGIGAWFDNRARVIGVEPTGCPTLHNALAEGRPVDVDVDSVAAGALGARRCGDNVFRIARDRVEEVLLVEDEAILLAQQRLWRDFRIATEPGGATALAALLTGAYRPERNERVGVLICGGNADLAQLEEALARPAPQASPAGARAPFSIERVATDIIAAELLSSELMPDALEKVAEATAGDDSDGDAEAAGADAPAGDDAPDLEDVFAEALAVGAPDPDETAEETDEATVETAPADGDTLAEQGAVDFDAPVEDAAAEAPPLHSEFDPQAMADNLAAALDLGAFDLAQDGPTPDGPAPDEPMPDVGEETDEQPEDGPEDAFGDADDDDIEPVGEEPALVAAGAEELSAEEDASAEVLLDAEGSGDPDAGSEPADDKASRDEAFEDESPDDEKTGDEKTGDEASDDDGPKTSDDDGPRISP